jgi:hypothetical protein
MRVRLPVHCTAASLGKWLNGALPQPATIPVVLEAFSRLLGQWELTAADQAVVSMWRMKSLRWRKVPWPTISPAAAPSGWMPSAAARSAELSWLVIGRRAPTVDLS